MKAEIEFEFDNSGKGYGHYYVVIRLSGDQLLVYSEGSSYDVVKFPALMNDAGKIEAQKLADEINKKLEDE